jgi:glycosyltransferase involved in cell wall biosynthesis
MVFVTPLEKILMFSRTWYPNHQVLLDKIQSNLSGTAALRYYLLSSSEKGREWHHGKCLVEPNVIPGFHFSVFSKEMMINPRIGKYLSEVKPKVMVITPWSEIGCFAAKRYAQKNGIPTIGWVVGLREWGPGLSWKLRSKATEILAKRFLKGHRFVFAYGSKAKEDAVRLGVSEDKAIIVKHVIDEDKFDYKRIKLDDAERKHRRKQLLLDDGPVFLCISQLIRRKGIDTLFKALRNIRKKKKEVQLLLIGDGPLRPMVDDFIKDNPQGIKWIKSVPYGDIAGYYALSDYSVVCSYFDDWCTVVNESHCARVPVICSDGAHCSYDLISHGNNGLIYPAGDVLSLSEAMEYAVNNPPEMERMAQSGYGFIQKEWNTNVAAKIWTKYLCEALD